jgi:hypothetical protein
MKTLFIRGSAAPPAPLRDVIARGSTAFQERRISEVSADATTLGDVDRIVFWAAADDAAVSALARQYARLEQAQRREAIVFVTPQGSEVQVPGLSPNEFYEWPCDEDRLKMAFMTGA